MKAIITGANGKIGQYLTRHLTDSGWQCLSWDRAIVAVNDEQAIYQFIERTQPDVVFHLASFSDPIGLKNESWIVNYDWPTTIAKCCQKIGTQLVYISSAQVFNHSSLGPYTLNSVANATSGTGYEKRMAEKSLLDINPNSLIIRLGWQIDPNATKQEMANWLMSFSRCQDGNKLLMAENDFPSCGFIDDTCKTLTALVLSEHQGGIYHFDSNRIWNCWQIATALNHTYSLNLTIEKIDVERQCEDIKPHDSRLIDTRVNLPPLSEHLLF
ncbi:hypothetical protein C2869_15955 [Saccharobesus litoralis]|uniref:dTDP-4-dehydrorhamnose reductase n=1 Tax=Saccharobesus litoralis TaxID=2172099 RepID=A0A2S0VUE2_9ALTE|nr:sugar nucleotide-binding protein [Saccharobesus litoralis]AWB67829.1 hypothetical protein C2869_15955 [Saccharobesus litoralis]